MIMSISRFVFIVLCLVVSIQGSSQPLFPCSSLLEQPYGICSHISRPNYEWTYKDKNFDYITNCGINWIRTDFDRNVWNSSNKNIFGEILNQAKKNNTHILPILNKNLSDNADYSSYLNGVIKECGALTDYWEVMNEVDLYNSDRVENAKKYVEQLKKIRGVIKRSNPDAKVVYGGIAGLSNGFFEQTCKSDVFRYADVMNFHRYTSPENLISGFEFIKESMDKYGWSKPVWLTETGCSTFQNNGFYSELLPVAYSRLGVVPNQSVAAILYGDGLPDVMDYSMGIFPDFKEVRYCHVSELKLLKPKEIAVLYVSNGEFFPKEYASDLVAYVENGGTIICPNGAPFYYDLKKEGKLIQSNGSLQRNLHLSLLYNWTDKAKSLKADVEPSKYIAAEKSGLSYPTRLKIEKCRYLTDGNLHKGDQFIPLVFADNGNFKGCIAGVYKLNSSLKGNVIVSTRKSEDLPFSETTQALWLPRSFLISFAYGVDKVFYYKLRAYESSLTEKEQNYGLVHKNFKHKTAYIAYRTLVSMCPDKSTRPKLEKKEDIYYVTWKRPDGKYITAVWTLNCPKNVTFATDFRCYDYLGVEKVGARHNIMVTSAVSYLVSSSPLSY